MYRLKSTFIASFLMITASQASLSATDATGSLDLQVTVPALIRLSNLSDIPLQVDSALREATGADTFCVGTNVGADNYSISISGDHLVNGSFALAGNDVNTTGNSLPMLVKFKDEANISNGNWEYMDPNTEVAAQNTQSNLSCASDNAQLEISVSEQSLKAVPAGYYSSILTLTVSTE